MGVVVGIIGRGVEDFIKFILKAVENDGEDLMDCIAGESSDLSSELRRTTIDDADEDGEGSWHAQVVPQNRQVKKTGSNDEKTDDDDEAAAFLDGEEDMEVMLLLLMLLLLLLMVLDDELLLLLIFKSGGIN